MTAIYGIHSLTFYDPECGEITIPCAAGEVELSQDRDFFDCEYADFEPRQIRLPFKSYGHRKSSHFMKSKRARIRRKYRKIEKKAADKIFNALLGVADY